MQLLPYTCTETADITHDKHYVIDLTTATIKGDTFEWDKIFWNLEEVILLISNLSKAITSLFGP